MTVSLSRSFQIQQNISHWKHTGELVIYICRYSMAEYNGGCCQSEKDMAADEGDYWLTIS